MVSKRRFHFQKADVATLRAGIARDVAGKCDGILMNFCPADFARTVVDSVRISFNGKLETACYLKVFYSKSEDAARRLAVEEFVKYDSLGHYHKMFEKAGISEEIITAAISLHGSEIPYSDKLSERHR